MPDLKGQFDAVIDTCGYAPDMVERLAQVIGPVHYVFVSSISVYDDMSTPQFDETASAPAATEKDLQLAAGVAQELRGTAGPYGTSYGRLKRSCEITAEAAFAGQCTLIRLGLIVGPRDYTDRFTWWVRRCDSDDPLLAPGPIDRSIQIIDVRDAANFLVTMAETGKCDTFNLTGDPFTIETMLAAICAVARRQTPVTFCPLDVFARAGLRHWTDLPLIVPDDPKFANMLNVSVKKARAVGLVTRPILETIQSVLDWDRQNRDRGLSCGMSPAQDAAVRAIA